MEHASARDMAAFAAHLGQVDPDRGAHTYPLRGGHVVLAGRDLFVNRALGVGFDEPLSETDLDELQHHSDTLGVPCAIEVSELTHASIEPFLAVHGFRPDDKKAGLVVELALHETTEPSGFEALVVETDADLLRWQEATAAGWGHVDPERRGGSDTFSAVAHATQTPGLILAIDNTDGEVAGCASLSIRNDVAILGGMSTLPDRRRQGLQRAMIEQRLELARNAGCTVAGTTAAMDSGSMRNLIRCGLTHSHTITTWQR